MPETVKQYREEAALGANSRSIWVPKAEAVRVTGLSPRRLEKLASEGRLRKERMTRQAGEKAAPVVYLREDISAIVAGAANRPKEPAGKAAEVRTIEAPAPPQDLAIRPAGDLGALLRELTAAVAPAPAWRPYLTLSEAAEYSGLPKAFLRARAQEDGAFGAIRVGRGWRFKRDAF